MRFLGKTEDSEDFVCFHCHDPLSYPFIGWASHRTIFFHPGCFSDWVPRIMRDLWDVRR